MRILLIGEDNPYGDPGFALYHLPRGASGDRLRRILGLSDVAYEKLDKVNLCDGPWDRREALVRAANIYAREWQAAADDRSEEPHALICLGAKVREAIKGPDPFTTRWDGDMILVGLPHPSGRCTAWNDPANVRRARHLLDVATAPRRVRA